MTPKSLSQSLFSNAQHTSNLVHVKFSVSKSSPNLPNLLFLVPPISVVKTKLHSWYTQLSVQTPRLNDSPTSFVLHSMNTVKFWRILSLCGSHFHILHPFHHYSHYSSWSPRYCLSGKKQKSNFPFPFQPACCSQILHSYAWTSVHHTFVQRPSEGPQCPK